VLWFLSSKTILPNDAEALMARPAGDAPSHAATLAAWTSGLPTVRYGTMPALRAGIIILRKSRKPERLSRYGEIACVRAPSLRTLWPR